MTIAAIRTAATAVTDTKARTVTTEVTTAKATSAVTPIEDMDTGTTEHPDPRGHESNSPD